MWTPTGQWMWKHQPARRTCWRTAQLVSQWRTRTLCDRSWWQWWGAEWSRGRPSACCSIRRRHTLLTRCSPTSQRPLSLKAEQWKGSIRWMVNRYRSTSIYYETLCLGINISVLLSLYSSECSLWHVLFLIVCETVNTLYIPESIFTVYLQNPWNIIWQKLHIIILQHTKTKWNSQFSAIKSRTFLYLFFVCSKSFYYLRF